MEILILSLILMSFIGQTVIFRYFFLQLSKKIPSATVPVQRSENEVAEVDKDGIEFSEDNPLFIPQDVKFDVEGGDSSIPIQN